MGSIGKRRVLGGAAGFIAALAFGTAVHAADTMEDACAELEEAAVENVQASIQIVEEANERFHAGEGSKLEVGISLGIAMLVWADTHILVEPYIEECAMADYMNSYLDFDEAVGVSNDILGIEPAALSQ